MRAQMRDRRAMLMKNLMRYFDARDAYRQRRMLSATFDSGAIALFYQVF